MFTLIPIIVDRTTEKQRSEFFDWAKALPVYSEARLLHRIDRYPKGENALNG